MYHQAFVQYIAKRNTLKAFNTKLIGGILLLAGTAIGGGLLALPIATAKAGFLNGSLLLILCWSLMMVSALITLEISLWVPLGANMISMSQMLLHPVITYISWISYLLLFYSITAAYIANGADFISHLGQHYLPIHFLKPIGAISFTLILGSIVYQGMQWVDYLNRRFMIAKLVLYGALVLAILPHVDTTYWHEGSIRHTFEGFSIVITSFAYANMIPSLRSYFGEDIQSLRKAVLIGGTMPLLCYFLWNMSVMGVIPVYGNHGLLDINQSATPASHLIQVLNQTLGYTSFQALSHSFSYTCILTTFLTCSFGLSDFLADGLGLTKHQSKQQDVLIYGATYIPPLLIALCFPGIFIKALHYAGIYCLILFVFIPVLLAWRGRYVVKYADHYRVPGGKPLLVSLAISAAIGIFYSLYQLLF